ncbi:MAG: TetR/AcrR family transcriptional regulator [Pseudomonadales bacterium]
MSQQSQEAHTGHKPPIAKVRQLNRGVGRPASTDPKGDQLNELIVAAAGQDYADNGYHGGSVANILAISGVSRPTFYRQFKSRREVLDIVIGRVNDKLREIVTEKVERQNCLEKIVDAAIDAYFEWAQLCTPLVGPIYHEINDPASPAHEHRSRIVAELTELFEATLISLGHPPSDPLLYEALLHVVEQTGHSAFWPEMKSQPEIRKRRQLISRILIASLAVTEK